MGGIFQSAENRSRVIWCVGIAFAAVQVSQLIRGYRITADDVAFFQAGLQGWDASVEATRGIAEGQGRIGAFVIIPINILSALASDFVSFRIFSAVLYILNFLLLSLWLERVIAHRIAAPMFLVFAAFNITDFVHLPPISYPLQNTLPFFFVIASRLYVVRGEGHSSAGTALSLVFFGFGMVATEYAFLLGTAMLGAEWLKQVGGRLELVSLWRGLLSTHILPGVAMAALVFAVYVGWRLAFPSRYPGNQIASFSELPRGIRTAAWHVISLHLLPYLDTFISLPYSPLRPRPLSWFSWLGATIYGASLGMTVYLARHSFSGLRRPFVVAVLALGAAFYVVFPISLTATHQSWCLDHRVCAFLDSQLAYLAFTVFLAALGTWLIARPTAERWKMRIAIGISAFAALHAVIVFIANQRVLDAMERVTNVWESAKVTVCRHDLPQQDLSKVFDPSDLLVMHPGFDRNAFWADYVDARRPACF
ncbi:hypothetical protein [Arvimicrobium flavum]|uniref:hypothetical protein n=1 Tax=Arvimicrobium flavum TaxID=3393320 RepID=UPI00237AB5B3|nr:hypothetical protein [Mesorhizobium shangrilense]